MCPLLSKVNCNDDLGILEGKWQGTYKDGVKPTEWSGSADILHRWVSSNCSPVRYGQCWVFASVLCTGTCAAQLPYMSVNFNWPIDSSRMDMLVGFSLIYHPSGNFWN